MGKHFLWDPVEDNIVEEFDDAGTTIADYTTEPYLYGDLISQHRDGQPNFYHYDGQGSTTSLTNSAADVMDTYVYSAFGEVTGHTGSTVNPFQYVGRCGYYLIELTGDSFVRRRESRSTLGRWISADPVETTMAMSRYRYADNSPLEYLDPSGLMTKRICEAALTICRRRNDYMLSEIQHRYSTCTAYLAAIRAMGLDRIPWWQRPFVLAKVNACLETIKTCRPPTLLCKCNTVAAAVGPGGGASDIDAAIGGLFGDDSSDADVGAHFAPGDASIVILYINANTVQDILDKCEHEIVHAYDYCLGARLTGDCRDIACSEIRAYSATTVCDTNGPARQLPETREECVLRLAEKSVGKAIDPAKAGQLATNCNIALVAGEMKRCYMPKSGGNVPSWPKHQAIWPVFFAT